MELMQASHQWANRPPDERFCSLDDLLAHTRRQRELSTGKTISSRKVMASPVEGDPRGFAIVDQDRGLSLLPTNWAFTQVAQRVGAPSSYLRILPSPLVADCLNWGFRKRDVEEIGLLSRDDLGREDVGTLAAATGPNYGRIWNTDIVQQLRDRFGDGLTGDFRIPGEFGQRVAVTKANTTLYASDRDMWVFLADETNKIEVPGRRDGKSGLMSRGFFLWNSEVGSATLGIMGFLFDYACCNRIVWGAEQIQEIKIRHTSGAPDRFVEEVSPALVAYSNASTHSITEAIAAAKAKRIDDVDDFLAKRFTSGQAKGIVLAHDADEGRPIETLWDAATGITAYARGIDHQDSRVAIERAAGKVLALAA